MPTIRLYSKADYSAISSLIEQLQDHLIPLDPLKRLCRKPGYTKSYTDHVLEKASIHDGAIFVSENKGEISGVIAGIIPIQSTNDLLEFTKVKEGRVIELYVKKEHRKSGTGSRLMDAMYDYFLEKGCTSVRVEVFAHNSVARTFYHRQGFTPRMIDMVRSLRAKKDNEKKKREE